METFRKALAAEGFCLVSEVDPKAVFTGGIDMDEKHGPQRKLLGICHTQLASMMSTAEPEMAAVLLGGGVASQTPSGRTRFALQDPLVIAGQIDDMPTRQACQQTHQLLRRVIDRLILMGD
ncbi:MAG: hypothetical protein LBP52_03685 [Burkholderiaceae bacterium]|nr:hypothetical protein [Burkholderiaceae bacterium]